MDPMRTLNLSCSCELFLSVRCWPGHFCLACIFGPPGFGISELSKSIRDYECTTLFSDLSMADINDHVMVVPLERCDKYCSSLPLSIAFSSAGYDGTNLGKV